ncbi:RHS repeat-associated core domain-containing protein [Treponema pedis]|nr:RHS repeat-associated core domain-containing protein [Treponema pedis]QSI03477.1 RHS repeat-associated core domain-containing protein [Treponema pedis]
MKVVVRCLLKEPNYLFRTAIAREQKQFTKIAFAVHLSAVIPAERYRSDSGALKSAVLNFIFFMIIINKMQQSAAQSCLGKKLSLSEIPTDRTFGNRWSRYKEPSKNKAEAYLVYVELILRSDAGDARIFSKEMTHTENQGDNEEQKAKRYYYHSDHLGSAQFVTDWRGKQYEHIEYTPYGELWIEETAPGIDKLPFRFTGKELDEETGLYYYGARYLDPKYSRWLSGDPALNDYIPQAPVNDEAKKHNENLPGMGGVFNTVNLYVYHYAGNNPVKYTDPDGRLLINNVSENSASAREYERNHNLRYIAFLIKTLDAKGNAQIPIGNIDIILEKGLNKSLTLANAVKNNPNYVVDVKAIASETKNGNYQIDIDVLVFHYGADGKLVCDVNNSGTIAFADSSELGVFGPNSSIDQKLVNQKANEVINTVLHISNANLVGDK